MPAGTLVPVDFLYDNGYGYEYAVTALIRLVGEKAEVEDIHVATYHGGEPSDHLWKCCTEKAIEVAWAAYEQARSPGGCLVLKPTLEEASDEATQS